jgi:hypothetical protein
MPLSNGITRFNECWTEMAGHSYQMTPEQDILIFSCMAKLAGGASPDEYRELVANQDMSFRYLFGRLANAYLSGRNEGSAPHERFTEKTTVNGIEISVGWDRGLHDYTLYFPSIELGEKAASFKVYDQIIRVGDTEEEAKVAFKYACWQANGGVEGPDAVYRLYQIVEKYLRGR